MTVAYLALGPDLPTPLGGTDAARAFWAPAARLEDGTLTLAFDHQAILSEALEEVRRKIEYTAAATAFCGDTFTLTDLVRLKPRRAFRRVGDALHPYRRRTRPPGSSDPGAVACLPYSRLLQDTVRAVPERLATSVTGSQRRRTTACRVVPAATSITTSTSAPV